MSRVNWAARSDYEFIQNYKLLQAAFAKHKIQRYVDVDKLIKAKYQDNLEFCQWLKAFHDQSGVDRGDEYDPNAARAKGKGVSNKTIAWLKSSGGSSGVAAARTRTTTTRQRPAPTKTTRTPPRPDTTKTTRSNAGSLKENATTKKADSTATTVLKKQNAELTEKVTDLETTMVEVEKERDFYFEKLRNVEIMFQVHQEKDPEAQDVDALVEKVFKVLYAAIEDNIAVDDDGEVSVWFLFCRENM